MVAPLYRSGNTQDWLGGITTLTQSNLPTGWTTGDEMIWSLILSTGHGVITPPGDPWRLKHSVVGSEFTTLVYTGRRGASNPPLTLSWASSLGGAQYAESQIIAVNPNSLTCRMLRGAILAFASGSVQDPPAFDAIVDDLMFAFAWGFSSPGWTSSAAPSGYTAALSGGGFNTASAYKTISSTGSENPGAFPAQGGTSTILAATFPIRAITDVIDTHIINVGASIAAGDNGTTLQWHVIGTNGLVARVKGLSLFNDAVGSATTTDRYARLASTQLPQKHGTKETWFFLHLDMSQNQMEGRANSIDGGSSGAYATARGEELTRLLDYAADIQAGGCKVAVILSTPNGEGAIPNLEAALVALDADIVANAASFDAICDIRARIPALSPPGTSNSNVLFADDVHLNSEGQNIYTGTIAAWFEDEVLAGLASAPVLQSRTPANSATGVSVSSNLVLDFDVNVQAVSGGGNVYIEQLGTEVSPTVPTTNTDAQNSNATSFVVDVPAVSTPAAGSSTIIVMGLVKDGSAAWTGTWPPTGWTVGVEGAGSTNIYSAVIWRRYTASAAATTFTLSQASENALSRAWVVEGAHASANPEFGTRATASSTAPDPPSLTPSWGSGSSVGGYYVAIDGNITSYTHPTGWTANGQSGTTTDGTTGNRVGQASSWNTGTSGAVNPGALTTTSGRWTADTWAVRPADPTTLLATIAITNTSLVTFSTDTCTINPASDFPASATIQVRVDGNAIEENGGGPNWAGFTAGQWTFQTAAAGSVFAAAASVAFAATGASIFAAAMAASSSTAFSGTGRATSAATHAASASVAPAWVGSTAGSVGSGALGASVSVSPAFVGGPIAAAQCAGSVACSLAFTGAPVAAGGLAATCTAAPLWVGRSFVASPWSGTCSTAYAATGAALAAGALTATSGVSAVCTGAATGAGAASALCSVSPSWNAGAATISGALEAACQGSLAVVGGPLSSAQGAAAASVASSAAATGLSAAPASASTSVTLAGTGRSTAAAPLSGSVSMVLSAVGLGLGTVPATFASTIAIAAAWSANQTASAPLAASLSVAEIWQGIALGMGDCSAGVSVTHAASGAAGGLGVAACQVSQSAAWGATSQHAATVAQAVNIGSAWRFGQLIPSTPLQIRWNATSPLQIPIKWKV